MNAKVLAVILFFVTNFKLCTGRNYTNYCLITIKPMKKEHMKYLRSLETQRYMDIKFWEKPYRIGSSVQVVVSPSDIAMFRERADHFNLDYTVLMTDLQRAFNNQSIIGYQKLRPDTFSFENFHILEDIYQWLTDLDQNRSYPVSHMTIGKSVEGRDISVVNININPNIPKKKVIVEGGIHGHEWASIVFVTYLINELSRAELSNNNEWKRVARNYDWYLIPVVNPDGYEYTHKEVLLNRLKRDPWSLVWIFGALSDRLWRKNRNPVGERIFGVDLNRNFDETFGKYWSSKEPADENFCGQMPFSEPETKALSFFATTNHKDLKYYFAIHSYGQKIIIPYEDRVQHVENFGEMESYSRQAVRKLYLRHNVKYGTGTIYDTTGARMSGTSASWVKKHLKVKYAYSLLLRDNGTYGFALPCDQLIPMCKESVVMMTELMTAKPKYVRVLYGDDAYILAPSLRLTIFGIYFTLK